MDFKDRVITSEYVSHGHPDKVADMISDELLGLYLREDPNARCGIETMVKDNMVILGGEVYTEEHTDFDPAYQAKWVFDYVQYPEDHGLSMDKIKVINFIGKQSDEIHSGVDREDGDICAGDQGFMVGFASNETETMMPLGHYIARKICQYFGDLCFEYGLGPDAKSQVTVEYDSNGNAHVRDILLSVMHQNDLSEVREFVIEEINNNNVGLSKEVYEKYIECGGFNVTVNPCGEWHTGGSVSDCGVTGRKVVVDHYGGYCNVGGGAFSGKDMTKVDRSGAYMARYIAKNIVAAGISDFCKVELTYMIGIPGPTAINLEMNRNMEMAPEIVKWLKENVDMTPKGLIGRFKVEWMDYTMFARDGHFGFEPRDSKGVERPWENTDLAEDMKILLTNVKKEHIQEKPA